MILAGHAYAGAVITSVNDERVKARVYRGAAPDEGETAAQVFYRDDKHSQSWGYQNIEANRSLRRRGVMPDHSQFNTDRSRI